MDLGRSQVGDTIKTELGEQLPPLPYKKKENKNSVLYTKGNMLLAFY